MIRPGSRRNSDRSMTLVEEEIVFRVFDRLLEIEWMYPLSIEIHAVVEVSGPSA